MWVERAHVRCREGAFAFWAGMESWRAIVVVSASGGADRMGVERWEGAVGRSTAT